MQAPFSLIVGCPKSSHILLLPSLTSGALHNFQGFPPIANEKGAEIMSEQICVTFRNEYNPQQNYTPTFPSAGKTGALKRITQALPEYGNAKEESSITDLLKKSAGYNIKRAIAELEKRRAEFFAQARSSEARAQVAEEKYEQAKCRLEEESNQRFAAEQRLKNLEQERLRQLQVVEVEKVKTQEALLAHGELKARLKKAEKRIKESERDATALTIALAKAYQKRDEAEATARASEEKAQIIESLFLRSDAGSHEAVKGHLVFGLLVFASRKKVLEMELALRDVEEKYRQQEDDFKGLLQKQETNLQPIPEKALLSAGENTTRNLLKPAEPVVVDDEHAFDAPEDNVVEINLKFIIYGVVVTILAGTCFGLITAFL